jgi:hypothetical protein
VNDVLEHGRHGIATADQHEPGSSDSSPGGSDQFFHPVGTWRTRPISVPTCTWLLVARADQPKTRGVGRQGSCKTTRRASQLREILKWVCGSRLPSQGFRGSRTHPFFHLAVGREPADWNVIVISHQSFGRFLPFLSECRSGSG